MQCQSSDEDQDKEQNDEEQEKEEEEEGKNTWAETLRSQCILEKEREREMEGKPHGYTISSPRQHAPARTTVILALALPMCYYIIVSFIPV